jgi:hypothetical protein
VLGCARKRTPSVVRLKLAMWSPRISLESRRSAWARSPA